MLLHATLGLLDLFASIYESKVGCHTQLEADSLFPKRYL